VLLQWPSWCTISLWRSHLSYGVCVLELRMHTGKLCGAYAFCGGALERGARSACSL